MSSTDSYDTAPNRFLPSMLRENGGKFEASLGKVLLNKFKQPIKSTPSEDTVESEAKPNEDSKNDANDPSMSLLSQPDAARTSPENTGIKPEQNTLDRVGRNELLKDVRSARVKAPSTRPKSSNILKEQLVIAEVPFDDDTPKTPPLTPEPKIINNTPLPKIGMTQEHADVRRSSPVKNRSERPLSVGSVEGLRRLSPEAQKTAKLNEKSGDDKVDRAKERNKVLAKGLQYSKSTEVLNPDCQSSTDKNTSRIATDKLQIRSLKNLTVNLAKSVKSMERDIANIKAQLSNLITLIGEIEQTDKK